MNLIKKTIVKVWLCVFWQASSSTEWSWFCPVLGKEQMCTQRALASSRYLFRTWADFQVAMFTENSSLLVPLGRCNKRQTREGGKRVRIFLPAGKQALQKQALQASPYRDTAHAHALPICLRGTSLLPRQNHCPPGKDNKVWKALWELPVPRRYGYGKSLSPSPLEITFTMKIFYFSVTFQIPCLGITKLCVRLQLDVFHNSPTREIANYGSLLKLK